ncbi:hypothetical protein ABT369_39025 [Dactylosporangium sp. NPDC000244]|uniref:hypothetical protein n=1 Tax=Dactylosporangium sp. NPDC000244 TaxID=3154365 RepID=UPI0033231A25
MENWTDEQVAEYVFGPPTACERRELDGDARLQYLRACRAEADAACARGDRAALAAVAGRMRTDGFTGLAALMLADLTVSGHAALAEGI